MIFELTQNSRGQSVFVFEPYVGPADPYDMVRTVRSAFPDQPCYVGCHEGYDDCVVFGGRILVQTESSSGPGWNREAWAFFAC